MTQQPTLALELIDFSVHRGGRLLIEDVSLCLPHGKYIELHGPNGCGKTSLLRALASIKNTASSTFYFGHQSGFRPELNVVEQLAISLRMYCSATDPATIKHILKRVGLAHQAQARIHQLSQGQIRRLMLAVMANSGCSVWLIDEPLNALDAQGIELLRDLLAQHFDQNGSAVIATHSSLEEAMPALNGYSVGKLIINDGHTEFFPVDSRITNPDISPLSRSTGEGWGKGRSNATNAVQTSISSPSWLPLGGKRTPIKGWAAFLWVLQRELKLTSARPQDIVWPSIFYWMTITLFPFGIGTDSNALAEVAGGIFWISALLATLIGAARFFNADYETGALTYLNTARISLSLLTVGKALAGWLFVGVPLSLASIPLALLYGLHPGTIAILFISLLLGTVSLAAFCSLFAALGLMARQAQIIICLLAFPVFVPLIIFGTTAVTSAQSGIGAMAPLIVLANLALLSMIALPVLTGRVLALALE